VFINLLKKQAIANDRNDIFARLLNFTLFLFVLIKPSIDFSIMGGCFMSYGDEFNAKSKRVFVKEYELIK
jgi:hypothetical protein